MPDQIQRQHRRVQAEPFAHIAGQPRAQVARARADDQRADVGGFQPGLFQSAFGRLRGEQRGVVGEARVQRVGRHLERFRQRIQGEVTADNAVVAEQDFLDDRAGAGVEPRKLLDRLRRLPALFLRETPRRRSRPQPDDKHGSL